MGTSFHQATELNAARNGGGLVLGGRENPANQLRSLYRFMAPREFVVSRDELIDAGFSPARIDNWLKTARLVKVIRNVYSYGRDIESRTAALRAALLAGGPGAVLTGHSACGVWGITRVGVGLPVSIEVARKTSKPRCLVGESPAFRPVAVNVVSRDYLPEEIRLRDGLALTNPALALIDFAVNASDRAVRFAFLEACRLEHFGQDDLIYCFNRLAGRRGAKKLRPYLALWVPELARVKSVLEGWFLLVWVERGYPMPLVNEKVFGYEVDGYWPEQRVVLELDGDAYHRGSVQKLIDSEKQRHLEANGLEVVRVTYGEFEAGPYAVVDGLAKRLGFI